ncbi:MAG: Gfo/Idh/MocA family protein [Candidatus Xenobia bacterium]
MPHPGIAFIGCGFIAQAHAAALRGLIDHGLVQARLVVACDAELSRAQGFEKSYGFARATADVSAAIADPDVQIVYIATPTKDHAALVREAAARGRSIFCEKPLAHTAQEAEEMAECVRKAGVPAQTGLVLRYSPVYTEMRALLHEAGGGRPMAAVFRDDQCFPIRGKYASTWRGDHKIAGGGTLIEHSIHDVDLLRWYFGEVKAVCAQTSNFAGLTGIEDVSAAILSFQSGASATLLSVWHQMDRRESDRHLELFSERAWVRAVHDFIGAVDVQRNDGEMQTLSEEEVLRRYRVRRGIAENAPAEMCNAYLQENLAFLDALAHGRTPWPGLGEAVRAHAIVDAIYESARTGAPVQPAAPQPV